MRHDNWPHLIKAYRQVNGLKQSALAYILGVDQTTISRWERGRDKPTLAMQKRLRDLMWKPLDSAAEASKRLVRTSPGLANMLRPGTGIIEISEAYAIHFSIVRDRVKGKLWRDIVGHAFFDEYIAPMSTIGFFSGEIAQVDLVVPLTRPDGTPGMCRSTVVPVFSTCGAYAVTQNKRLSDTDAADAPHMRVHRFDALST